MIHYNQVVFMIEIFSWSISIYYELMLWSSILVKYIHICTNVIILYTSDIVYIWKENAFHFTKCDDVYLGYFISRAEKCFWVVGCMKAWLYQLQQKDHTFCYEYVKQVWYAITSKY